jgi:hypothetical protein
MGHTTRSTNPPRHRAVADESASGLLPPGCGKLRKRPEHRTARRLQRSAHAATSHGLTPRTAIPAYPSPSDPQSISDTGWRPASPNPASAPQPRCTRTSCPDPSAGSRASEVVLIDPAATTTSGSYTPITSPHTGHHTPDIPRKYQATSCGRHPYFSAAALALARGVSFDLRAPIDEYEDGERIDADAEIAKARGRVGVRMVSAAAGGRSRARASANKKPHD